MRLHRSSNFQAQRTPLAWLFSLADFILPLKNSIVPEKGSAPTFCTRASSAWITDNEGKVVEVPTNCARFQGARYVRNLILKSEDIASWTKINGGTGSAPIVTNNYALNPNGDLRAARVQISRGAGTALGDYSLVYSSVGVPLGIHRESVYLKSNTESPQNVVIYDAISGVGTVCAVNTQWSRFSLLQTSAQTTTQLVLGSRGGGSYYSGGDADIDILVWHGQFENVTGQADQTASEYVSVGVLSWPFHDLGVDGVKAFTTNKDGTSIPDASLLGYKSEGARVNPVWPCSDMTHANWVKSTTGSELVTNGTFNTDISGWTDDASGWSWASSSAYHAPSSVFQTLRQPLSFSVGQRYLITFSYNVLQGKLRCQARTSSNTADTSLVLSNITGTGSMTTEFVVGSQMHSIAFARDLAGETSEFYVDNVSVKLAGVQPVLNATDVRGFPNTATTLTAEAAGATIAYPVALSGTRAMSIDLKRSVGTGTIEFTHDGTTWTNVTSSLSTSTFVRVRLENKTVSNPHSIGLRFGTSGDAVIACAAQDEDGPTVSTRIFAQTAPMTRAADSGIVFNRGSVLVNNAGTAYARWSTDTGESTYLASISVLNVDVASYILYASAASLVTETRVYDGTTALTFTNGLARANTALRKQVSCWSGTIGGPNTGLRIIAEGGSVPLNTASYDTIMGAASTFTVGGTGFLNARDIYLWGNRAVTDAQMVELNT